VTTHTSFPASSNNRGQRDAQKVIPTSTQGSTLADILERVLDKGIVIAGDISVSVATTELLNIRIRLLICSVDKAKEIGINWWETNPYLSSQAQELADTNQALQTKIQNLEAEVLSLQALAGQSLSSPSSGHPHVGYNINQSEQSVVRSNTETTDSNSSFCQSQ